MTASTSISMSFTIETLDWKRRRVWPICLAVAYRRRLSLYLICIQNTEQQTTSDTAIPFQVQLHLIECVPLCATLWLLHDSLGCRHPSWFKLWRLPGVS